jgi:hypothetical protein
MNRATVVAVLAVLALAISSPSDARRGDYDAVAVPPSQSLALMNWMDYLRGIERHRAPKPKKKQQKKK